MLRGGERVLELDLDVAAAEHGALGDVVGHPAGQPRDRRDDEARRDVGAAVERAEARGGVHAGLVLRRDGGARGPPKAPRRRSFNALRETHSKKR